MRFGLDGKEPKTLQQVGDELGITRERVRQLQSRVIKQIRAEKGDKLLGFLS